MRILQIVPLLSPKGEYGGPTTVALEQCAALQAAGHNVILAAGSRGYTQAPNELNGVPLRLFDAWTPPGIGLRGLSSPGLISWAARVAPTADVVHVHLARDLASLPAAAAALARGANLAVQTHGMVQPTKNPLAPTIDALLTRRVLRGAGRVFYLTDQERDGLRRVAPSLQLQHMRNGIGMPLQPSRLETNSGDAPVQVLYLARLHARKRPMEFVEMAAILARRHPTAHFTLIGPDEGEGDAVRARVAELGLGPRLRWIGPVDPATARDAMAQADLYVLPSIDEPYPMSVLEALAHGVPVVVTDSNGLAALVAQSEAGTVVPATTGHRQDLIRAVDRYLNDVTLRRCAARNARIAAEKHLSMPAVVEVLTQAYGELAGQLIKKDSTSAFLTSGLSRSRGRAGQSRRNDATRKGHP